MGRLKGGRTYVRKISPFYRTSSPTGAAAQKEKEEKGVWRKIHGVEGRVSECRLLARQEQWLLIGNDVEILVTESFHHASDETECTSIPFGVTRQVSLAYSKEEISIKYESMPIIQF